MVQCAGNVAARMVGRTYRRVIDMSATGQSEDEEMMR